MPEFRWPTSTQTNGTCVYMVSISARLSCSNNITSPDCTSFSNKVTRRRLISDSVTVGITSKPTGWSRNASDVFCHSKRRRGSSSCLPELEMSRLRSKWHVGNARLLRTCETTNREKRLPDNPLPSAVDSFHDAAARGYCPYRLCRSVLASNG